MTTNLTPDAVRETLETIYGSGPMVTSLASVIVDRWDEWQAHAYRDLPTNLCLCIWDWFPGGDTAKLAADRILAAVEADHE